MVSIVLSWLACGATDSPPTSDGPPPGGTTSTPSPPTGTSPGVGGLSGSCVPATDNVLRVVCTLTTETPEELTLTWVPSDGSDVAYGLTSAEAADHVVTARRMKAETTYTWEATTPSGGRVSGAWTTGALPTQADVEVSVDGDLGLVNDLLAPRACEAGSVVLAVSGDGDVVWYQDVDVDLPSAGEIKATIATPTDEVAVILDNERIRRFAFDGTMTHEWVAADAGVDRELHHDLFVLGDRMWVLSAYTLDVGDETFVVDAVTVVNEDGSVAGSWDVETFAAPNGDETGPPGGYWGRQFPGAVDYSHANGLFIEDDGTALVSFLNFDAVLQVDLDPDSGDFGQVEWVLGGEGDGEIESTIALEDPAGVTTDDTFSHQHHPTWDSDGNLRIFDNGGGSASARLLRMSVDAAGGTAEILESWPLDVTCPAVGGHYVMDDGRLVGTCGSQSTGFIVDPAAGGVVGSVQIECSGGIGGILSRVVPVSLATRMP